MARGKTFKQRFLSFMITILMMAALVVPSFPSYAVEDKIDVGQPAYNAVSGTMTYYNCLGTGSNLYKSLVINFTSVRKNGETAILPTMDGFNYETGLSTDGTYVINIPEGKNLVQIASYIRKVQFTNCQNSSQKINFSIGKDIVKYMTFYSEDSQHYYQFIKFNKTGSSIKDPSGKTWGYGSWEWAYYTALSMKYEGLQGYLATVSNVEEDAFIYKCSNEIGWLGGTRMKHAAASDTNGIPSYNSFTSVPDAKDSGIGYWYWACGPDANVNGGKFLPAITATNSTLTSAENSGLYNNWNSGEPNNSGNEFVMTTLKIGSGWSTGNRNGKIGTKSDYYVASGYSWNDIIDTNWAPYGPKGTNGVTDYTATGFFVEYGDYVKGLSKTALVQKTNFEFKTTTQPLSHIWNLYAADGSDTIKMYCTAADPKCSYYGANPQSLGATIDLQISSEDVPADGKTYNSITITGANEIKMAANNNATISEITYYKTDKAGAVSGGTALSGAPKDIGYYYATVTVAVKNTVLATNTVTATAVTPFKIYDPDADFAVEGLNNKVDKSVPYQTKVNAGSAHSDLEIVFATGSDSFEMYKIADMDWNGEKQTVNNIAWIESVQNWIDTSSYAATAKTPYELSNGKASSSTISSFYKDMLKANPEQTLNGVPDIADFSNIGKSTDEHTYPSEYKKSFYKYVDGDGNQVAAGAPGATKYSVTYDDIEFGIYAILAKDGNNNPYAVTVAAVYPQQSGPKGAFYIQDLFTVYIKEVEPTIDKFINDKKQDIAEIGDTENPIEFTIDFQLPQYKDRITTGNDSGYQLTFEDIMAPGFTKYEPDDEHRLQFYYLYPEDNETKEELIAENGIPEAVSYKFTATSLGANSFILSKENAKEGTVEYTSNPTASTVVTKNTDLIGSYATPRTSKIFEPFVIPEDTNDTQISITFDEPAIRSWKSNVKAATGRDVSGFRIRYYAVLDADAEINSNGNTNTAYIHYEKDSSGNGMTEMHDTVHAYTYGLNVIKIDGSAANTAYLAGAEFKLYKELLGDKIPTTEEEIAEITGDTENYYVLEGDTDRYFKKVVMNNGTFISKNNDGVYDTLVSVGTADGITAKGLGDGNYIMVETKAPTGYNELAEDIYFEINKLADDEMALADNSYIWFREMATDEKPYVEHDLESVILNEKGCISIDVYNYQGLTLPSTGGMGILLFIIIGTAVMATVLLIIINKRRRVAI